MRRSIRTVFATLLLAGIAVSCGDQPPLREGPQLTKFPEGFVYDANLSGGRALFPDRPQVRQRGYICPREPGGTIQITEYDGAATEHDVARAIREWERQYGATTEFGPIETVTLDQRPAWAWTETQNHRGKVLALGYGAIVSYDATTYHIEFHSADPEFMDLDLMRRVVGTFAVGEGS